MHTENTVWMDGSPERIFELACRTEDWPRILPHYRAVTVRDGETSFFLASVLFQRKPDEAVDGDEAYWMAGIYALLGDRSQAIAWMKRTVELGNINYPWFSRDKNFDSMRDDPEYRSIMAGVQKRWEMYKNSLPPLQ